ncbi:UvrD-helicase domain-containing protein, partial [Aeromicrobium sp. REDSEA-S32_B7]|uniref:UvrD-helicase domain-containing protein n=1 Tax=Aeromicrobium sp. REDSEA-S32_B7 TaxID=1811526 RepID=UPI000A469CD2
MRDLLSLAPVRRRFALTDDDLEQVDEWTVQTAIRWGVDADARAAWQLGGLAQNTWRTGLERLALGVVTDGHDDPDAQDDTHTGNRLGGVLPLDDLGSTGVDLVGRFTEAVERLAAVLESSRPQPVDDWVELLTTAVQTLTDVPARDAWQREQVLRVLADLTRADTGPVARGTLTVVEVAAFLTDAFAPRPTRTSFRTGSLTVCTMVPMRSVPHRVVCLLGLDSGAFPRTPTPLGDDVLARTPLVGERDAAGEDRQLFLDAVLSATEHLVITYTGASEHTGRSLPPATPVGELLDQLARTVPTADVRSQVLVQHPLQAFDTSSFIPGALVPGSAFSFDTAAYAGARATVRPQVPEPPFLPAALPGDADPITTLDTLRDLVRHPVRSFVTGRLDVRLPYEDEPIDDSVPLGLDHLERWKVKDRVLAAVLAGVPGHDAEADERRRGLLPPGPLGDAELARVRPEVGTLFALAAPLRTDTARSVDVDVELGDGRRVIGTVAGVHPHHALRVTASTVQGRQLLEAWVDVLALAAAGQGRPAHLVGRVPSGYRKAPGVITLAAPSRPRRADRRPRRARLRAARGHALVPAARPDGGRRMSADAPVVEFDIADPLPTGTTLLEASAGTGKTWAIAALVTRLVAEGVATLDQLLVVTFGRAASAELKDRVRERLVQADAVLAAGHGDERDPLQRLLLDVDDTERTARRRRLRAAVARFDEATITTTHGFCQAVLRSLGTTGDVEPGSVLVEDDTDIVDQVVSDLYLRAVGRGQTPPFDHQEAAVLGRRAVEDPSAHLLPTDAEPGSAPDLRRRFASAVRDESARRRLAARTLSYDDLLQRLAEALEPDDSPARTVMRDRWRVVLVDEFQDTDPVQWRILERAFVGHATMVLVGDPKQAIYGFRGGDVDTYLRAAAQADTRRTLTVNHRSDAPLVSAVDAVLRGAALGDPAIVVRPASASLDGSRLHDPRGDAPFRLRAHLRSDAGSDDDALRIGDVRPRVARDVAADVAALLGSGATYDHGAGPVPLTAGDVAVLENTRFHAGEGKNDPAFADALAEIG